MPLYKRALEIYERAYGKDHSIIATVLVNMADFYERTGRKDEAEKLKERVREIYSKYQR